MIWKSCVLYAKQPTGKRDKLGNEIYERVKVMETFARFTPWTDEQIAAEERNVTKNEQIFVLPISPKNFPKCYEAEINGVRQKITKKIELSPRYIAIQVKAYKE